MSDTEPLEAINPLKSTIIPVTDLPENELDLLIKLPITLYQWMLRDQKIKELEHQLAIKTASQMSPLLNEQSTIWSNLLEGKNI